MSESVTIVCRVDDQSTLGKAERRDLAHAERLWRAARMLGVLWLMAALAILVPVLHFVLVPGFFLLGIGLSLMTYLERSEILSGEVACPNCQKSIVLLRSAEEWPKTQRCPSCSYTLTIERAGGL